MRRSWLLVVGLVVIAWALLRAPRSAAPRLTSPTPSVYDTLRSLYYSPPESEAAARAPPLPEPSPSPPPRDSAARAVLRLGDDELSASARVLRGRSRIFGHKLRCEGLLLPEALCAAWYAQRDLLDSASSGQRRGGRARQCEEAHCHGHGVCDLQTGVCACEAGYNGSACRSVNLRECNGKTDGLWHASHCAGECDERRGFCWCPGRIGERPMGDTCQVKHMPVEAFAALVLKPDPAWIRFAPNGSKLDAGVNVIADRSERDRRRQAFDDDLVTRASALQSRGETKRAAVVQRFWFGYGSSDDKVAGGSDGRHAAWRVSFNEHGIPHAVRLPSSPAQTRNVEPSPMLPPQLPRRRLNGAGKDEKALPPASMLRPGPPDPTRDGALYQKLAARPTSPHDDILGAGSSWCEASAPSVATKRCPCLYDGLHGDLCEKRHEAFCLNQCSGHGQCDENGGFCHCDEGYFGVDCSMTTGADGRVRLHSRHAAVLAPRTPSIYVYELWDHTSLILQYRAYRGYCAHRFFDEGNGTEFNDAYAYTIETSLHEQMLNSAHRTLDGENADFYYVPSYLACTILPVYDWVGPGPFALGYPMRPATAMRMAFDALEQIRTRWPYFNRSVARVRAAAATAGVRAVRGHEVLPNHIFLFPHDEGACWAPKELFEYSILLTHWGRKDMVPHSSSRYIPDNWEHTWTVDERAPAGQRWDFARFGGSRQMIGVHPCYAPHKDIVVPVLAPPSKWGQSPWLNVGSKPTDDTSSTAWRAVREKRATLAYFSGNLALNEPLKYARGIRHRVYKAFHGTPGWRLVGKAGGRYSLDLSQSEFCLVPPGGDGWSSRVDDAVRHGCIPVIIMDNVHMPFETSLNYSAFSLRVPERDVEQLDTILRAVTHRTRRRMRAEMKRLWVRFTYARSFLDVDAYLPPGRRRDHLEGRTLAGLRTAVDERGAPDAFDTIMLELVARREAVVPRDALTSLLV